MKEKKKYRVSLGNKKWLTLAISPRKAINNIWWKNFKFCDAFTQTDVRPSDFEVEEVDE